MYDTWMWYTDKYLCISTNNTEEFTSDSFMPSISDSIWAYQDYVSLKISQNSMKTIEPFDLDFDFHLFLQDATVIG